VFEESGAETVRARAGVIIHEEKSSLASPKVKEQMREAA
jgi:septum formation topological specificity factor MinE